MGGKLKNFTPLVGILYSVITVPYPEEVTIRLSSKIIQAGQTFTHTIERFAE